MARLAPAAWSFGIAAVPDRVSHDEEIFVEAFGRQGDEYVFPSVGMELMSLIACSTPASIRVA